MQTFVAFIALFHVRLCVCVCVRACVHACVRACVRASVRVCARAHARAKTAELIEMPFRVWTGVAKGTRDWVMPRYSEGEMHL